MRIGEIVSSAKYRMGRQFKKFPILNKRKNKK